VATAYAFLKIVAVAGHFLSGIATGSFLLRLILEERGHTLGELIAKAVGKRRRAAHDSEAGGWLPITHHHTHDS